MSGQGTALSSLSIRRPVLATVFSIVIVVFGLASFTQLGVREFPAVDPPVITVQTEYAGANAEIIESQITEPLEEFINAVAGIRTLSSVSREGRSTIRVEFSIDADLEVAANDVREQVSQAVRNLPPDADPPIVRKEDADSSPVIFLNVYSPQRSLLELTALAENDLQPIFETIPGVSRVDIWGQKQYSMRLWMNPHQLKAHGLTPLDIQQVFQRENIELPSGRVDGENLELTVRSLTRLNDPEEFNRTVVRRSGDRVVRFEDVGFAEIGPQNERTILRRDGIPMVGVVLRPQPGANQVALADEFHARWQSLKSELPDDVQTAIGFDTSEFVRRSINEVQQTLFIALALVILVIFLFLRNWRTTIIPVIVIPIALTGSLTFLFLAGFSLNVLTLLGLVLAIGLVVDDAIIVVENIFAKMEKGMSPREAGVEGIREIFPAIIATTLSLIAVFMPILFLGGLTGRLFREFGVVLGGAVVISSFVALTFTPMLCTKLLRKKSQSATLEKLTEPVFGYLYRGYDRVLEGFLRIRWLAFPIILLCCGAIAVLLHQLPQELSPLEDRGRMRIGVRAPEGANFAYMDRYMERLNALIEKEVPEARAIISVTSPGFGATTTVNSGFVRLILSDAENRERTQQAIADRLSAQIQRLPGARAFVSQEPSIGDPRQGQPVQYVLQARTLERMEEILPRFLERARSDDRLRGVDVDLQFNRPETEVRIDRDLASQLNISAEQIASTLQIAMSEQRMGFFLIDGKQYQVIGQIDAPYRQGPEDLRWIPLRTGYGEMVTLDQLVSIEETIAPPQRFRFNRFVSATVSASLAPGVSLGQGIEAMDEIAAELLDDTFRTSLDGLSREFVDSADSLLLVFFFALLLVYLVLAAQFESFRDPLIIMLTVPLALSGAFAFLWIFDQTLNVFSQIAMIMLIGLVTKNGILVVEFANQRKATGLSLEEAVMEGAKARFRPVLMTSLSTILGILPIAMAVGAGAESRISMGLSLIGGLIVGSALTLLVIPAMYTYLSRSTPNN